MTELEDLERGGAFYGRRRGKRLRAGQDRLLQTLLPQLRIEMPLPRAIAATATSEYGPTSISIGVKQPPLECPTALFPTNPKQIRLEIGFGGGEHLAAQARAHPEIGFIGCEPFVNGVAKLLSVIDREQLGNIRLWDRDAADLIPHLPPASLDRIYVLYPDPWPKRRQRKRRLLSDEMLRALARVLRPGADLRFATDIDDYAGWVLARVLRSSAFVWTAERPDDWRKPWPDWPGTRYEAKAVREGRTPVYLTFRRT